MRRSSLVVLLVGAILALAAGAASAALFTGGGGNDVLNGTPADDSLYGRDGNDSLSGQAGNDDLDGGPGADDLRGGPGTDAVSYAKSAGATVTLDDRPDDGAPGEGDNVHRDVEAVYGSGSADTLAGDGNSNTLDGQGGDDKLTGGARLDFLYGGPGDDLVDARDGKGQDIIDCGPGSDRVILDQGDTAANCEARGAPYSRRAQGTIGNFWLAFSSYTTPSRLEVFDISPADATVRVTCRGGGCPVASRSFKPAGGRVKLLGLFGKRKLRVGTRLEISIVASDALGKYVGYTMRGGRAPKVRRGCLEPGGTDVVRCP